jgi:hypothetical protein
MLTRLTTSLALLSSRARQISISAGKRFASSGGCPMEAVDIVALVEILISAILKLVPHETAREMLDAASVKRAEDIADAAEAAKLAADSI